MTRIIAFIAVIILFSFARSFAGNETPESSSDKVDKAEGIKTVAFYLQDGVEVLDFAGPMEAFAYAGYEVFTVSKTKDPIVSQGVLKILPDYSIADAPEADMLVFFGGNSDSASNDKELINWVKNRKNVKYYFSVCTGVFMLAEAGILDGQKATTFHSSLNYLEQAFPKVSVLKGVRFVDNGNVVTTAGISAGIDGALHMIAKLQGFGQAKRVAYYMEYDNWTPGNGVFLGENPYLGERPKEDFMEYYGTYEFLNGSNMVIKAGIKGELTVVVDNREMPLFYDKEDKFINGDGRYVSFKRDATKGIVGFTLEKADVLFKKKR